MCVRKKDMFVVGAASHQLGLRRVISNPITLQDYVSDYESTGVMRGPVHDSTQAVHWEFSRGCTLCAWPCLTVSTGMA